MYPFREIFMALLRMELSGTPLPQDMAAQITPELLPTLYKVPVSTIWGT